MCIASVPVTSVSEEWTRMLHVEFVDNRAATQGIAAVGLRHDPRIEEDDDAAVVRGADQAAEALPSLMTASGSW